MLKTENLLLKHCNKIFFKSQNTLFTRFWCWLVMNSAMGPEKKNKNKKANADYRNSQTGHDLHENNHKTQTVQILLSPQQVLD